MAYINLKNLKKTFWSVVIMLFEWPNQKLGLKFNLDLILLKNK